MKNIDMRVWVKGIAAVASAIMAALAAGATNSGAALAGVGALVLYLDKTVGDAANAAKAAAAPQTPTEVASELLHTAAGLMTQAAELHAKAAGAAGSFGGAVTTEAVRKIVAEAVEPMAQNMIGPEQAKLAALQAVQSPATVAVTTEAVRKLSALTSAGDQS